MPHLDIGIVVPTLGTRPRFIRECLQSIRESGTAHVCVVAPKAADLSEVEGLGLVDQRVDDPGNGLASAINSGLNALPDHILLMNWLGDDDLLEENQLDILAQLMRREHLEFVWGRCRYIDENGRQIWVNRSGSWAGLLVRFGPNLIPQPGALFSRRLFTEVGGLDTRLGWAFDQDLFTKFVKRARHRFVPNVVSSFRWHRGSLSAGSRDGSVREGSQIRVANLPLLVRPIATLWEMPLRSLVRLAGMRMDRRLS